MYRYEWTDLVTNDVVTRLLERSGENGGGDNDALRASIALVCSNAGGLPVTRTDLADAERTALAESLLSDALGRYLTVAGISPEWIGHYVDESEHPGLDAEVHSMPVVDINRADQAALDALPMIGAQRAKAILEERAAGGAFVSLEDLADRVDGVGDGAVVALRHITKFEAPIGSIPDWTQGDALERRLLRALAEFGEGAYEGRLARLLDSVASVTSATPHPATVERRPRGLDVHTHPSLMDAEHVGVLDGSQYWARLPDFLREATDSIAMAMFHVALPGETHPTKALLEELVAARERGVDVRVVLDRDRDEDPYMSTVINTAASEYLQNHGVDCRFDTEDELLHSKYIVIDGVRSVIGSHNWSAGSYFQFDDTSFVVESAAFASQLTSRFDEVWDEGA